MIFLLGIDSLYYSYQRSPAVPVTHIIANNDHISPPTHLFNTLLQSLTSSKAPKVYTRSTTFANPLP